MTYDAEFDERPARTEGRGGPLGPPAAAGAARAYQEFAGRRYRVRLVSSALAAIRAYATDRPLDAPRSWVTRRRRQEWNALLTSRRLQVVLELLWLLDAGLQYQPHMFTRAFVTDFLAMNAMYQPHVIGELIITMAKFLAPHAAAWNAVFATIQLAIGTGLLWRRTVCLALAVSFAWVLGVWVIGEGSGSLFTGTATLVGGAPGPVLLYGLVGVLLWQSDRRDPAQVGNPGQLGTSVAAEGPLGERGGRIAWAVLWGGGALLQILPGPYPPSVVLTTTVSMNLPEPGFLAGLDRVVAGFAGQVGDPVALLLAATEALVAVHVLRGGRLMRPALLVGVALSLVFWVLGQNFGGILAGNATDPGAGPLYVLLAATLYPRRHPEDSGQLMIGGRS